MSRVNVLSGQVHGTVDWISADGRELGMFLRSSPEKETMRCVCYGPEVERMIANKLVQKGMLATAFGEMTGRLFRRKDNDAVVAEAMCNATKLVIETSRTGRARGALYANLKGVAMHWDDRTCLLRTYFNEDETPGGNSVTCSIQLKSWVSGLREEARTRFMESLKPGREFTTAALLEPSSYKKKTGEVTVALMLLPTDFRLQG